MKYETFIINGIEVQVPIHFKRSEFRGWYNKMSPELVARLNLFRERLGYPVYISPAFGAVGRMGGNSTTRHNYERYKEVQAIDVMPSKHEPERWIRIAEEVGFKGIGYYPDWEPDAGLHLDDRGGALATWGAVRDTPNSRQRYTSLSYAVKKGMKSL